MPLAKTPREPDNTPTWRRLDILGVILMMDALICFILALTEGPVEGWGSAAFIAPFILSFFLVIGFFTWEARIPPKTAVLPSSVWKIPNIIIASLAVMVAFPFWATSQLQYATYWQIVGGWTPIKVAAAMLPQGLTGLVVGGLAQAFPVIITKPRITIPAGGLRKSSCSTVRPSTDQQSLSLPKSSRSIPTEDSVSITGNIVSRPT